MPLFHSRQLDDGECKSVREMCDICERSVSSFQGCLLSDFGQSQFKRKQFIRAGCATLIGVERWESHECNKPGHLRTDCSFCKKRIAEKGNKHNRERERVETTAVVQRVMVETSEYGDGMQNGSRFRYVSGLTTRGTTPPLSPISECSTAQRGYKKVHRKERVFNTLVESSRLVPVMSVTSLERNGTSVAFTCSGEYDSSRQPRPLLQSSRVSLLTDQMRSGTRWVQANWRVTVEGKSSVNKLAGVSLSQITTVQEGGATSSTDVAEPATDSTEVDKTSKESVSGEQGQLLRAAEPDQCVLKVTTQQQRDIVEFTHPLLGVSGKAADDPHWRRQDERDSGLDVASIDHCDMSAEVGMFNKKLKFKFLVSHRSGAVAALEGQRRH